MDKKEKLNAIILFIILIAIGGLVLYGENKDSPRIGNPPKIKGPQTPPTNP